MPIFELTPNNPDLPDWEASTHREPCRVCAPDSLAARRFARAEFLNKAADGQYRGQRKIFCPWTDQSLVRCRQVADDDTSFEPGAVIVPGPNGWGTEAAAPPDAPPAAGPDDAPPPAVEPDMPPAEGSGIAARLIANRDRLAQQARDLLAVLDDITAAQSAAGSGEAPPSEAAGLADGELIGLLRGTRDELHQLNLLLENAGDNDRSGPRGPGGKKIKVGALSNVMRGRRRS